MAWDEVDQLREENRRHTQMAKQHIKSFLQSFPLGQLLGDVRHDAPWMVIDQDFIVTEFIITLRDPRPYPLKLQIIISTNLYTRIWIEVKETYPPLWKEEVTSSNTSEILAKLKTSIAQWVRRVDDNMGGDMI